LMTKHCLHWLPFSWLPWQQQLLPCILLPWKIRQLWAAVSYSKKYRYPQSTLLGFNLQIFYVCEQKNSTLIFAGAH
jgi:hypothetical protein